jgi:hypothetical protein
MVGLQIPVVDTAQGPTQPELLPYRSPPLNEYEWNICNSQVEHPEDTAPHRDPDKDTNTPNRRFEARHTLLSAALVSTSPS